MSEWLLNHPRLLIFLWVVCAVGFFGTAVYGIATAEPEDRQLIIMVVQTITELAVSE
jgi:hypothetical protein